MAIDSRSAANAYASKSNIVFPGTVAQRDAAMERAAQHAELNNVPQETTRSRAVNVTTVTYTIRRNLP